MSPSTPQLVRAAAALALLGLALGTAAAEDPFGHAAATARAHAAALARTTERGEPLSVEAVRDLLATALVDPERFASDGAFREHVLSALPTILPADAPERLRNRFLYELETDPGLTFEQSEVLELSWGAALRATRDRHVDLPASGGLQFPDDGSGPIEASVFSFPSRYLDAESAVALLGAVERLAPERELIALVDLPLREAIARLDPPARPSRRVHWVETYGRPYSPWPRDPFSLARRPEGGLVLVERPAAQGGREGDLWMARELLQNLPPELDRAWGGETGVAWGRAPFFFHNGHMLMAGGAAWTSIHGLERRILERLDLERVPVESFATAEGVARYGGAARSVMAEMEAFYGKPVRLVHPLPANGLPAAEGAALMRRVGGGAGIDLDSVVTLVPDRKGGGALQALVGDLTLGRELIEGLEDVDLASMTTTYGLGSPASKLRGLLSSAQSAARAEGLQAFLDLAAEHLSAEGLPVRRVPLLFVPTGLLEEREHYDHDHFLIGWNNVVLESRGDRLRAEGFASGIPAADRLARRTYAAAGVDLTLLPPLVGSVVANGGYRCASHQVRAAPSGPTGPHP